MIIRQSALSGPLSYDIQEVRIVEGDVEVRLRNRRGATEAYLTLTMEELKQIAEIARPKSKRGR
jgi:hypothetical protein